jgi:hypothetical protein
MKIHVKILGIIYCALACFLGAFILLGLVIHILHSVGFGKGEGLGWDTVFVILLLSYPALWLFQIGLGLLSYQRSSRLFAIIVAAILLVGLNTILLLFKDRPGTVGAGWVVFHLICIGLGVYTLMVLLPGWGRRAFQEQRS